VFELLKKKIWANFQRIIELFMQKIVIKLSKIWFWDPGSRGKKGSGSRIRNTGDYCYEVSTIYQQQRGLPFSILAGAETGGIHTAERKYDSFPAGKMSDIAKPYH